MQQLIVGLSIMVLGVLVGTLGGYIAKEGWDSFRETKKNTQSSPSPATATRFSVAPSKFTVTAGTQRMSLRPAQLTQPFSVADLNGVHPFSVHVSDNGTLFVDADIYAGRNHAPIKLRDNRLVGMPENWDQNHDDRAIEVVNQHGEPVFQLEYSGDDSASVKGIFDGGRGGLPGVRGMYLCDDTGWASSRYTDSPPMRYYLRRLFKYPSRDFQQQRERGPIVLPNESNNSFTKPTAHQIYEQLQPHGNSSPDPGVLKSFTGLEVRWPLLFAGKSQRDRETLINFRPLDGYPPIVSRANQDVERSVDGLIENSPCIVRGKIESVEPTTIWLKPTSIVPIEVNNHQIIP